MGLHAVYGDADVLRWLGAVSVWQSTWLRYGDRVITLCVRPRIGRSPEVLAHLPRTFTTSGSEVHQDALACYRAVPRLYEGRE